MELGGYPADSFGDDYRSRAVEAETDPNSTPSLKPPPADQQSPREPDQAEGESASGTSPIREPRQDGAPREARISIYSSVLAQEDSRPWASTHPRLPSTGRANR